MHISPYAEVKLTRQISSVSNKSILLHSTMNSSRRNCYTILLLPRLVIPRNAFCLTSKAEQLGKDMRMFASSSGGEIL